MYNEKAFKLINNPNYCRFFPNCSYYANEAYPNELHCVDFDEDFMETVVCPRVIIDNLEFKIGYLFGDVFKVELVRKYCHPLNECDCINGMNCNL